MNVFRKSQLANQWDLADIETILSGKGFGFLRQPAGDANLARISDTVIAPSNSLMDCFKNLEPNRTDITLLGKTSIPSTRQLSEVSFQFSSQGQLNANPIGSTDSKALINDSILGELGIDFNYLTAIS